MAQAALVAEKRKRGSKRSRKTPGLETEVARVAEVPVPAFPFPEHPQPRAMAKEYEIDVGGRASIVVKENRKFVGGVEIGLRSCGSGGGRFGRVDYATWLAICRAVDMVGTVSDLITGYARRDTETAAFREAGVTEVVGSLLPTESWETPCGGEGTTTARG